MSTPDRPQRTGAGSPPPEVHVDTRLPSESAGRLHTLFRRVLLRSAVVLAVLTTACCLGGYLLAGRPGLAGALCGAGLAAFYLLTTVVVMLLTTRASQTVVSAAVGGSWLVKTLVTLGAVVWLSGQDFFDPVWLFVTVVAAILGTLAVELHAVAGSRIPLDLPAREDAVVPPGTANGHE